VSESDAVRLGDATVRRDLEDYVSSLLATESADKDLLWCQIAEGRRTLDAIDSVLGDVLDSPLQHVGHDELGYARLRLRMLIRDAEAEDESLLASAWRPWLLTLRVADQDQPGLRILGSAMWSLIEPVYIHREEGESCLTPVGFRADADTLAAQSPKKAPRYRVRRAAHAQLSSDRLVSTGRQRRSQPDWSNTDLVDMQPPGSRG